MTHSYAVLEISRAAYEEIRQRLVDAGYGHAIKDAGEIDMHGIALAQEAQAYVPHSMTDSPETDRCLLCGKTRAEAPDGCEGAAKT